MKTILWLCNKIFSEEQVAGNGSWLQPLAEQLQASGKVRIINVAIGPVKQVRRQDHGAIEQWIIPKRKWKGSGQIPPVATCREVAEIERQTAPDMVHIWGTESIWASIHARGYLKSKALLNIQGILSSYYRYYYGGLTLRERLRCIGLKELLMPWRTLYGKKENFHRRGQIETQAIGSFDFISYQSEWTKNQLSFSNTNPRTQNLPTRRVLRAAFYKAEQWQPHPDHKAPVVFSSCSAAVSYKGLHTLIKAIALVKRQYPGVELRLAGTILVGDRLLDGYSVFLRKLIRKLGLQENVRMLGSLPADAMIREMQQADVCVVPSYIETYCLAFAEPMMLGTPTVCSFAGAMPELAEHGRQALFYNPIDHETCAAYIDRLFIDKAYAKSISDSARERRFVENAPEQIAEEQIAIYNTVMGQ